MSAEGCERAVSAHFDEFTCHMLAGDVVRDFFFDVVRDLSNRGNVDSAAGKGRAVVQPYRGRDRI